MRKASSGTSRWTGRLSGQSAFVVLGALLIVGCAAKPNAANIELRKQVQSLESDIAKLKTERDGYKATIAANESQTPRIPQLPQEKLETLFTTHGVKIGKGTGPIDNGLKVSVYPTDESGDALKAAGAIVVEAFDLSASETRIGKWEFTAAEARKAWLGQVFLYEYVLKCPWKEPPAHDELTIKVTFTDELTGRVFTAQKVIKITRAA